MAHKWIFGLLAAVVLLASCDGATTASNTVDSRLRGTWESTDTSQYSGTLVIEADTITITGYSQSYPVWPSSDDTKQPFRDFAKNIPLACWTEDEKLFIQTGSGERSLSYMYSTSTQGKFLLFTFGERDEALKRTEN